MLVEGTQILEKMGPKVEALAKEVGDEILALGIGDMDLQAAAIAPEEDKLTASMGTLFSILAVMLLERGARGKMTLELCLNVLINGMPQPLEEPEQVAFSMTNGKKETIH